MHLLHVIGSMAPISGGPAQGIRNSNFEMQKLGVHREVVCLDDPKSAFIGSDDFIIHALGPAKGPWRYSPKLIPWLVENLDRFDAVIINGLWLYNSYATWRVINNIKKKFPGAKIPRIFVMPHGMLDPYFQRAKERKLKAIRNWIYWKLIERKVVNDADALLFTCNTELLLAREPFKPYHPRKEYNVGYGIEAPPPYHQDMSNAFNKYCPGLNGQPYLLFISRIHAKKGVDLLIKAYVYLHTSLSLSGAKMPKLVIAGPGLETNFGKLLHNELKKTPEVKTDVFFTDMLTGDAKWGAFYGCDAFILPSHQENFGIAVAEALACGKPVLISNQVNIWREIEAKGAGFIDNDTLEGAINLMENWIKLTPDKKTTMRNAAYECYKENFSIEQFTMCFFKVINSSCKGE
jgi:glycosyltransferase involved in cell wall biosynthesis